MSYHKKTPSKHHIDDFLGVIPLSSIEGIMSLAELKKFYKFMKGQTMMMLPKQAGVYYEDLMRFLADTNDGMLYD